MSGRLFASTTTALLCLTLSAAPARADWLLTPFLGVTFGGATDNQHATYGGSLAWMGAGVVGVELDASFVPDLLDADDGVNLAVRDSNASTLMANLIVGAPLGAPGERVSTSISEALTSGAPPSARRSGSEQTLGPRCGNHRKAVVTPRPQSGGAHGCAREAERPRERPSRECSGQSCD